jgi:ATP-dependent Lhr-like helicase
MPSQLRDLAFTANESDLLIERWFADQRWKPLKFQREAWQAFKDGESGLIHVPTGAGKTYASYFGPIRQMLEHKPEGLTLLYVTPLRAVARDIELALRKPLEDLDLPFTLGVRNGDTTSSARAKQKRKVPNILIITPESLSLLLSYSNSRELFKNVKAVILDEWHELLSTKRGTLLELSLSQIRNIAPNIQTWALSATLGNLEEAAQAAVGANNKFKIISHELKREVITHVLIPEKVDSFPWAGHLGSVMTDRVLNSLSQKHSTLIFTNTRSQAERWHQLIIDRRPEWQEITAVHHGSIDRKERERIEFGLKIGSLKIVVATSSLDLGVDFSPVNEVFQIGSPKSVARLLQRAGRGAHRPEAPCEITLVPTNSLELIEMAALKKAVKQKLVEPRKPLTNCLDVLAQHLTTCALGGGFDAREILQAVRSAYSYKTLTDDDFNWTLNMLTSGGYALQAYPQYRKLIKKEFHYSVESSTIARSHRMNIGTITSDSSIQVAFLRGKSLGSVEEHFISKLKKNDTFTFAGRCLKLIKIQNHKAFVKLSPNKPTTTPRWLGGKLPFSHSLSLLVREELHLAKNGIFDGVEMQALKTLFNTQSEISRIPKQNECLIERLSSREGEHLYIYPFEGRQVHEGLASVLTLRLSRNGKSTFAVCVNDYGLEILGSRDFNFEKFIGPELFDPRNLMNDILESLNMNELGRRRFREIARIAGFILQNHPGLHHSNRQVQVSSSLLFDVLTKYEPDNRLLRQANDEVLFNQLEEERLFRTMKRLNEEPLLIRHIKRPSPLSFPLLVERMGATVMSNETLVERVERIKSSWVKSEVSA